MSLSRPFLKKPIVLAIATALVPSLSFAEQTPKDQDTKLDAIMVVGERILRDQQETTTSVRIFVEDDLANLNAFNVTDVLNKTANVTADVDSFTIRGIKNTGVTQNSGGSDSSTIFVDNIPLASNSITSSTLNSWDLASIEVLRGAQSTNQGANTQAGAVIISTKDPEFDTSGQARFRIGDYNTYETAIAQGGSLMDDVLAYRLSLQHITSDGYTDNPILNDDKWHSSEELNGRAKLLWQPTGSADTQVLLTLARQENETPKNKFVFTVAPTEGSDAVAQDDIFKREAYMNTPWKIKEDLSQQGIIELKHKINNQWQLSTASTLMDYDYRTVFDEDRNAERDSHRSTNNNDDVWSHEIKLNYTGEKLRAVTGLYISNTSSDTHNITVGRKQEVGSLPPVIFDYETSHKQDNTSYALYFDGDYSLTNNFTINAGLRLDHTMIDYRTSLISQRTNDLSVHGIDSICESAAPSQNSSAITCNGLADFMLAQSNGNGDDKNEDTVLLPKLGFLAKISPNMNLGYSVQRAFRSAGTSLNIATREFVEYDAEFSTNHELSLRSQWFDQTLTVNANAFYVDWRDQQVTITNPDNRYDSHISNAGKSVLSGAELEVFWQMNANFDSFLSLGYVDTEFKEFLDGKNNFKGNEFANAADTTASFGVNWDSNINWFASLSGRYTSDSYMKVQNELETDAYTVFDTQVGYQTHNWKISAYVKNLSDEEYILDQRTDTENDATYVGYEVGAPRTVGMIAELYW